MWRGSRQIIFYCFGFFFHHWNLHTLHDLLKEAFKICFLIIKLLTVFKSNVQDLNLVTSNLQSICYLVLRIIHWNQAELAKSQRPKEALMTLLPKLFWRFGCHCSPFAVNHQLIQTKNPPEAPWLPFSLHLCFIIRPWYCEQFRMSILIKP